jgi:hypothetical protein
VARLTQAFAAGSAKQGDTVTRTKLCILLILLVLLSAVVSCASPIIISEETSLNESGPVKAVAPTLIKTVEQAGSQTPTVTISELVNTTPSTNPLPLITATPIVYTGNTYRELSAVISDEYSLTKCVISVLHLEGALAGTPKFTEMTSGLDARMLRVEEISDSLSGNHRAYLVLEPHSCTDGECFQNKVYIEERTTRTLYQLDWDGYMSWRPISRLIWIGNEMLVFSHPSNPHISQIVGISMVERDFLFYSIAYGECPLEDK